MAVGPYIGTCERLLVCPVRVEGQEQCGAFLDDADSGVSVAVNTALVPFGLSKPALQIEVVLRHIHVLTPNKQPRSKAGHDVAKMFPGQVIALLELLLQDLKRGLTLGTRALVWFERRLDRPDILHRGPQGFLGVVDRCQPSVNVAR